MNLLAVEILLLVISVSLDFIMVSTSRTERHLMRIADALKSNENKENNEGNS